MEEGCGEEERDLKEELVEGVVWLWHIGLGCVFFGNICGLVKEGGKSGERSWV